MLRGLPREVPRLGREGAGADGREVLGGALVSGGLHRRDELRGALVGGRQRRGGGRAGGRGEGLADGREVVGRRLVGVVAGRGLGGLLRRGSGAGSLVGRYLALLRRQRLGLRCGRRREGLADRRKVVGGRLVGVVARRGLLRGQRLGLRYAAGLLRGAPGLGGRLRPVLGRRLGLALLLVGAPRGAPGLAAGRLGVRRAAGRPAVRRVGRRTGRVRLRGAAVLVPRGAPYPPCCGAP